MTGKRTRLSQVAQALVIGGTLFGASPAPAATLYHYIFTFDALGGSLYPQNSIAMVSPILLRHAGEGISTPNLGGTVNGFAPMRMEVFATMGDAALSFISSPIITGNEPAGLAGLLWGTSEPVVAPGTYYTADGAGRGFSNGIGGYSFLYTSGSLQLIYETIPDPDPGPGPSASVPEPMGLGLLAAGLGVISVLRRRHATNGRFAYSAR